MSILQVCEGAYEGWGLGFELSYLWKHFLTGISILDNSTQLLYSGIPHHVRTSTTSHHPPPRWKMWQGMGKFTQFHSFLHSGPQRGSSLQKSPGGWRRSKEGLPEGGGVPSRQKTADSRQQTADRACFKRKESKTSCSQCPATKARTVRCGNIRFAMPVERHEVSYGGS